MPHHQVDETAKQVRCENFICETALTSSLGSNTLTKEENELQFDCCLRILGLLKYLSWKAERECK